MAGPGQRRAGLAAIRGPGRGGLAQVRPGRGLGGLDQLAGRACEVDLAGTDGAAPGRRLTYWGEHAGTVAGWTPDGEIIALTASGQPFERQFWAHALPPDGGPSRRLPYGPVAGVAIEPGAQALLNGCWGRDPAYWKRYRGGTAGRLWTATAGGSVPAHPGRLNGQFASPMLIGDRLAFLSDHEGTGNVYSCRLDGSDLRRHTDHDGGYARQAATDGHAGGVPVPRRAVDPRRPQPGQRAAAGAGHAGLGQHRAGAPADLGRGPSRRAVLRLHRAGQRGGGPRHGALADPPGRPGPRAGGVPGRPAPAAPGARRRPARWPGSATPAAPTRWRSPRPRARAGPGQPAAGPAPPGRGPARAGQRAGRGARRVHPGRRRPGRAAAAGGRGQRRRQRAGRIR